MTIRSTHILALVAFVIVAGITFLFLLDQGWKTIVTQGEVGPFVIGDTKLNIIEKLARTKEASGIIVGDDTLLLKVLASEIGQEDQNTKELEKALASDVWRVSPNMGHIFYTLEFRDSELIRVVLLRYFM